MKKYNVVVLVDNDNPSDDEVFSAKVAGHVKVTERGGCFMTLDAFPNISYYIYGYIVKTKKYFVQDSKEHCLERAVGDCYMPKVGFAHVHIHAFPNYNYVLVPVNPEDRIGSEREMEF